MSAVLLVNVIGDPAPQGSKRHVGGGRMVESSKKVGPWRETVAATVAQSMADEGWAPTDGPVAVVVTFYVPRPKSAPKRVTRPFRKPDIDKLVRSTLDALVMAGALVDDARVVSLHASKEFAGPGHLATGANIQIGAMP
jgi:crossover junction endodeoxyribonuclease RusA